MQTQVALGLHHLGSEQHPCPGLLLQLSTAGEGSGIPWEGQQMESRECDNPAENKLYSLAFVQIPGGLENTHQVECPRRTGTRAGHKVSPAMSGHPLGQISHETAIVKGRSRHPVQDIPRDFIHP